MRRVLGIVGAGFDSASVTAVLASPACAPTKECALINLVSKGFDYLVDSAPAAPGGRYIVAVKNAHDAQFAEGDLTVAPKLEQLSTIPPTPVRNVQFQFSIVGKGFWVGQSRIRIFLDGVCPKPKGSDPTGWNISPQSTATRLEGHMRLARPGIFEVGVESGETLSNLVKLEVK